MTNIIWVIINAFLSLRACFKELVINLRWLFVGFLLFESVFFVADYFPFLAKITFIFGLSVSSILYWVIDLSILALVAIRVHRTLLPSDILNTQSASLISSSESTQRYLIRAVWLLLIFGFLIWGAVFFGFFIPIYLSSFFNQFVGIPSSIYFVIWLSVPLFIFYKISPIALVLPSIANYEPLTFSAAMTLGQKHRPLMFVILIVIPVLIALVFYMPFYFFQFDFDHLTTTLLSGVLYFLYTVIEVSLLSAGFARAKFV